MPCSSLFYWPPAMTRKKSGSIMSGVGQRFRSFGHSRRKSISCEPLIDETETELDRVLSYYKMDSLEEMRESSYRRAVELLNRKRTKQTIRNGAHAQD